MNFEIDELPELSQEQNAKSELHGEEDQSHNHLYSTEYELNIVLDIIIFQEEKSQDESNDDEYREGEIDKSADI